MSKFQVAIDTDLRADIALPDRELLCRQTIYRRDNSLSRHIHKNGDGHPRDTKKIP